MFLHGALALRLPSAPGPDGDFRFLRDSVYSGRRGKMPQGSCSDGNVFRGLRLAFRGKREGTALMGRYSEADTDVLMALKVDAEYPRALRLKDRLEKQGLVSPI